MHLYFFILSQARITKIGKEIHSGRKRSWLITVGKTKIKLIKNSKCSKETRCCLLCHWITSSKGVVWSLFLDGGIAEAFWKYGGFYFQLYRKYCPFLSDEHLAMVSQITADYCNLLSLELNVNITHFQLPENALSPSLPAETTTSPPGPHSTGFHPASSCQWDYAVLHFSATIRLLFVLETHSAQGHYEIWTPVIHIGSQNPREST